MNPLCRVRVTKTHIIEGSILAANGAWNRKYRVVKIDGDLYAKPLGRFYADGRVFKARRARPFKLSPRQVFLSGANDVTYSLPPHAATGPGGFCEYWHVEPRKQS